MKNKFKMNTDPFVEHMKWIAIKNNSTSEENLGRYKHRMELIRTCIGIAVLVIQFIILYHIIK